MSTSTFETNCGECGEPLCELSGLPIGERTPCPSCGSLKRRIDAELMAAVKTRVSLSMKGKRPGVKKALFETRMGDDLHRATGHWNKIDRLIDRQNDRYREVITNPKTGEIIRHCDEPLSEHKNRGSAKPSTKKSDA